MKDLLFRRATKNDLGAIVRLLADDHLGAEREVVSDPPLKSYLHSFAEVDSDPWQELIVAELAGRVVGCLQLTIIPGLSNQGARSAQIEAVRVDSPLRSQGIGEKLLQHAIGRARHHKCLTVQLTTDQSRVKAHRFYERLGFHHTHLGFKLPLA